MLVVPSKRAVVLSVREPRKLTALIPHARTLYHKGKALVAVPHRLEETKLLRNLDVPVPSPMLHYYEWPGGREPFAAQKQTAAFLTLHNRAFVLNDLGTGKTFAALAAYDYLKQQGQVNKLLVISPLSTLERTWADEIMHFFPHLEHCVLHGTKDRRLKLLDDRRYDIYIINHDGIKVVADELASRSDIDVVVIDESATFRNASSGRWKVLHRLVIGTKDKPQLHRRVWALTGTPIPNAPTDAWAQCRLVCPDNVPKFFSQFRDKVMRQVSMYKWVARDDAIQTTEQAMQPAVRFTRDQCVDLPPVVYQERSVELTPEQKKLYVDMMRHLHAECSAGSITAANEGVKLSKLLQIACGMAYGDNDKLIPAAVDNRVAVVEEIIEQSPGKVIVFVPYKAPLGMLKDRLSQTYSVAVINGDVPKSERDVIFRNFQKSPEPRVLIAQPAAMSHGLTLTAASTIVWYGAILSHDIFEQANGRITRPGQKHSQLIVTIEGCDAERKVYSRLRQKKATQGTLLEIVKGKGYE